MTRDVRSSGRAARRTDEVRTGPPATRTRRPTTRISSKNQVTIPAAAAAQAGLRKGDTVRVEAAGAGRVVLTRVDELLDQYSGSLAPGTFAPGWLDKLRDEWD